MSLMGLLDWTIGLGYWIGCSAMIQRTPRSWVGALDASLREGGSRRLQGFGLSGSLTTLRKGLSLFGLDAWIENRRAVDALPSTSRCSSGADVCREYWQESSPILVEEAR